MHNDLKKILNNTLLCSCIFFVASCTQPNKIIPVNTMKLVVWDMYTADEWYNELQIKDSTAIKKKLNLGLYKTVMEKHKITKEEFFNSYDYYLMHPLEMQVLIDSVEAYGTRLKNKPLAK